MQYQIERPNAAYVRINWTQALIMFTACFVACTLVAVGVMAFTYFLNRKQRNANGNYDQAQNQGQNHAYRSQKNRVFDQEKDRENQDGEAQNHREAENGHQTQNGPQTGGNQEKVSGRVRGLNGRFVSKPTTPTT